MTPKQFSARPERFFPKKGVRLKIKIQAGAAAPVTSLLSEISASGLKCHLLGSTDLNEGDTVQVEAAGSTQTVTGNIKRIETRDIEDLPESLTVIYVAFEKTCSEIVGELRKQLREAPYITGELSQEYLDGFASTINAETKSAIDFYFSESSDLFAKCRAFQEFVKDLQKKKIYQPLYRLTLTSGLDHRIAAFNPLTRREEEFICLDSNSYLGLHRHPRVTETVKNVLSKTGYGTPSAQLLCGTNRYLRELEDTISQFHKREDTIVFPSGYSANIGVITALVRKSDLIVRDRFSHASIQDGCRWSGSRNSIMYPHRDVNKLDQLLTEFGTKSGIKGKLIITDGVFSMHGGLAPLPKLVEIARKHGAKLMVDEAHSTGVIGPTGRGIEEHFELDGTIDVLMGTFSKAPGTAGGYITGSKDLIYYLRFYAHSSVFTASLPAATCAGVNEAFKIMQEEPQHRERLWQNVNFFAPNLAAMGFIVSEPNPILTVFMGSNRLLWAFSRDLFSAGIKCGTVAYPAVPDGESILRLTMNARHTDNDLSRCLDILKKLGQKYGILHKTREEVLEIGEKIVLNSDGT